MMTEVVRHRRVLVLGRSPAYDIDRLLTDAASSGDDIVMLCVGYPQTAEQERFISTSVDRAFELRVRLVAELVPTVHSLGRFVEPADRLTIVAEGSERRRLERALGSGREQLVSRNGHDAAGRSASTGDRPHEAARPIAPRDVVEPLGSAMATPPATETIEHMFGKQVAASDIDVVWTKHDAVARKRGRLSIYFGAAPGVGKTYAMLSEAQRAAVRGTDVVVGIVETYERPLTISRLEGLERIPPRRVEYRGTTFDELDVDAVLERDPERVLIDELAHTNVPGSRRAKRWEDVLDILATGITVISTLNAQHLASLNDVVARVTGVRQQETVPDWLLDLADQVELVDMSPYALQRRMVHGNVYRDPQKTELALRRFFTIENLTALRELALMRVANQVDDELLRRWHREGAPETRERILVCVSARPLADELIRRGARIANRSGGDLLVAHAHASSDRTDLEWHAQIEQLVRELGGEFRVLTADEPVDAILSHAYEQHVTQVVVGESLSSRWEEMFRGSFVTRLIRRATNVDVHVIARRER
jgi:nucleotide-binding universal stress UspA family protein